MTNPFIFTEAYNCADILKNCLESFYKYHDDPIYVFGKEEDLELLKNFDKIIPILIEKNSPIDYLYQYGHAGTARIFSEVITKYATSNMIIHFDSDLIFKEKCIDKILDKLIDGYDIVGPVRAYKNNPCGRDDIRHMQDVVATCFFGFNKDKITRVSVDDLVYQINGMVPYNQNQVLDFFDYISFDILNNGGKIFYLDYENTGGANHLGHRINKYGDLNKDIDCGDWFIHFAGIGSGARIYKNGLQQSHPGYAEWAIKRFALYKKLIENIDISNIEIDLERLELYKKLV